MALSLSNFLMPLLVLLAHGLLASAATVTYDWNITWVTANPDGLQERPTIGINGQWPLPQLNFTKGDQIIANVNNQLGNETVSMHFHGFFQNGTNEMDGPVGVNQCAIQPGSTFTYNFTVSASHHSMSSAASLTECVGHTIRHVLVPLARPRPVPRRPSPDACDQ